MKRPIGIALVAAMTLFVGTASGQTIVKPGFNVFSVAQDVEIGRQSALQAEQQLPMVTDATATRYVSNLGARLAAQAPGTKYNYQFKIVNASDVNAFALPGGFVYVNRGLLDNVRSEGELAGVMAHEIAHVALRHGTNQASKAYLANAGIGILGGLLGGKAQTTTGSIIGAVGGFGLNTLFLKFSRSAESQADVVGAQIMARAGYDPMDMAHYFTYMGQQAGGNPGKVAQFLSNHPAPADREARVRQEAALLAPVHLLALTGNLRTTQTQLRKLPAARTTAQLAQGQPSGSSQPVGANSGGLSIEAPSSQFRVFRQSEALYQLEQPDNWDAYTASSGYGVTIVPRGGYQAGSNGRQNITHGVIVNHYVPFDGAVGAGYVDPSGSMFGHTPLGEATSDLVRNILEANPGLRRVGGSEQSQVLSGHPTMSIQLEARTTGAGAGERVTVVARQLPDDHIVYMLLIAPDTEYAALEPTFDRMVRSFRSDESTSHN
jgi:Zn-dependent protease with chaperone function